MYQEIIERIDKGRVLTLPDPVRQETSLCVSDTMDYGPEDNYVPLNTKSG